MHTKGTVLGSGESGKDSAVATEAVEAQRKGSASPDVGTRTRGARVQADPLALPEPD